MRNEYEYQLKSYRSELLLKRRQAKRQKGRHNVIIASQHDTHNTLIVRCETARLHITNRRIEAGLGAERRQRQKGTDTSADGVDRVDSAGFAPLIDMHKSRAAVPKYRSKQMES
uniref:Uncharacterized protein n=1 Tax=Steinernema glaseri TaxID=37863 RepID=A0A1I7Z5A9_9BILA